MATVDVNAWHNTGGNGKASAVWIRRAGSLTAEIRVMPFRCMVTLYVGRDVDQDYEGIPIQGLEAAKSWADSLMSRQHAAGRGL